MSCNSFCADYFIGWSTSHFQALCGYKFILYNIGTCAHIHTHTHPREQEDMIKSLRASQLELEAENEALKNANARLHVKTQDPPPSVVADHAYQPHPPEPDLNSSGESSSSIPRNPSITRLDVRLDVDLTSLPTTGGGQGGVATATATVPIKFDSSYRAAMEKGL